jgi:hypothetical protein
MDILTRKVLTEKSERMLIQDESGSLRNVLNKIFLIQRIDGTLAEIYSPNEHNGIIFFKERCKIIKKYV